MKFVKSSLAIAVLTTLSSPVLATDTSVDNQTADKTNIELNTIEKITVTSSFKKQSLAQTPASIAVVTEQQILEQGNQHFEDLLSSVANLNFSGGTSRPKYLQIRGVGERSEYRGAPNSSVGFIIDDIDLSGLGMAANMFDVQQVEVLRGPQGTRFGANALAGLIYIQSNEATDVAEYGLRTSIGDDQLRNLAGFASGPLSNKLNYRVSIEQHQQNGFRDNNYLNKDDTNGIDELSGKLKLTYQANEDLRIDFALLFADMDNGFDAWTLDNNGFKTLTDKPGVDNQKSSGGSFKVNYLGWQALELTSISSFTSTKHQHAYDGDWANPTYWADKNCTDYYDENGNGEYDDQIPCVYDYLWSKKADRDVISQEFRINSTQESKLFNGTTDWLMGVYLSELDEGNDLDSSYNGWPDEVVDSKYQANNYAVFSQFDSSLDDAYQLSLGLRFERRTSEYSDSLSESFKPQENMWGGHIALSKTLSADHDAYIRIARGYKAGGFNMGLPTELSEFKEFETETLVNYELGFDSRLLDNDINLRFALFYMDRQDQQVNASQQNPEKPQRFIIYTANAASSSSVGAELDFFWQINPSLSVYSAIGYLDASYDDYGYFDKYGSEIDISGRQLAHAPEFTYSFGSTYRGDNGLFLNINASGKSSFYFSDSHDEKANSSYLVNARIGYEFSDWSIYVWARNLSDEKVATRGFYFGNEPDIDWASKKYQRYGAPRHLGLTLDYQF